MESITSLSKKLKKAKFATPGGAAISLQQSDNFYWDPAANTVFYNPNAQNASLFLLHELGHALLGHGAYNTDIELIGMERAAWERAKQLCHQYGIAAQSDIVQDSLDTYRDWLHARSLCPHCGATGVQAGAQSYQCFNCNTTWRVNEARTCALRRYKAA